MNEFIHDFNHYDKNKSILQLFEECIQEFGSNIAVSTDTEQITYYDLNKKANKIANFLSNNDVKKGSIVAIYMERSIELIVAIIAIVKVGCIYLPLDIDNSKVRQEAILDQTKPFKIITTSSFYNSLFEENYLKYKDKLITIDTIFQDENQQFNDFTCTSLPEDLLYIMYTSGSTGIPRGCKITNKAVVNLVKDQNYIKILSKDIISQVANPAFDAMTFELWGALLNGAQLRIISKKELLSSELFNKTLKNENINISFFTTAFLNLIVKNYIDCLDKLKYLLFGGEKANTTIINLLLARKKDQRLKNLNLVHVYGPTECTTFSLFFNIDNDEDIYKDVPIGNPIKNVNAYILNSELQPVNFNEIGELFVGGVGLAQGYLNDRDDAKDKFIYHPQLNERIYKTGDLVYENSQRQIVFVGRTDNQIKIRGFRVELGEIEACLSRFSNINQVTVDVEELSSGSKELLAYITMSNDNYFNLNAFRLFLKENLPLYMRPNKVFVIDKIPLTNNGKVDKNVLKNLKVKNILSLDEISQPENKIEKIITEIWQKTLNMSFINITENFFEMGGNSLMLTEICMLINDKLGHLKNITVMDIFTYPTVKLLSNYLNQKIEINHNYLEKEDTRTVKQRTVLLNRKILRGIK